MKLKDFLPDCRISSLVARDTRDDDLRDTRDIRDDDLPNSRDDDLRNSRDIQDDHPRDTPDDDLPNSRDTRDSRGSRDNLPVQTTDSILAQFQHYCSLAVLTNNYMINLPILSIIRQIYPELLKQKPRKAKNPKPIPNSRMVTTVLKHCRIFSSRLKSWDNISSGALNVLSSFSLEARQAVYSSYKPPQLSLLPNIKSLYSHQAAALQALETGSHVIVTTGTSSGKSLIYQLPIADSLASESTCSILLFPTIALGNDQKRAFESLFSHESVFSLDSSVSSSIRKNIRSYGRVIFTNPDIIHVSVLPYHHLWKRVLLYLKYLVIDELHQYSGQFGTHFAFIIKRLLRLASFYGNDHIQIIACSATISNPVNVDLL